jgi:mycofactocin precursor peptide peptidase
VPLGSLEQHGPHLPLDTDTRIAAAVAREHAGFPGTLSIGTPALTEVLVELGRDGTRDWDAVLFVNGHGGNLDAVSRALDRLQAEGRRCGAFHVSLAGDAHAGRTETSLMLHIDPAAVRLDLAAAGETRPVSELMDRLRRDGVRAVSPNGVLGDPRGATAAHGRSMLAELVDGCAAHV